MEPKEKAGSDLRIGGDKVAIKGARPICRWISWALYAGRSGRVMSRYNGK